MLYLILMQFLNSVILCNQFTLSSIKFQCISVDNQLNTTRAADFSIGETESNSERINRKYANFIKHESMLSCT